mmetsp:Transcript_837/g.1262  ORF Transcript_837/g.1262 Transcript_837/m.1262 type:complete len:92 (+) Transcript_837:599-874(+)
MASIIMPGVYTVSREVPMQSFGAAHAHLFQILELGVTSPSCNGMKQWDHTQAPVARMTAVATSCSQTASQLLDKPALSTGTSLVMHQPDTK